MKKTLRLIGVLALMSSISIVTIPMLFVMVPGIPPNIEFTSYTISPPLPRTGALAPDNILNKAERLFENEIIGPESIAWKRTDEIYVGVQDGTIRKISGNDFNQMSTIVQIGEACEGNWQEHICGRPLGLRFAPDGRLLVADAYYGIYAVDVEKTSKECLVGPTDVIEDKTFRLPNDLDVDGDGNIYWTDSSSDADLSNLLLASLADGTGRVIRYNAKTKTNTVLMKGLHIANGVQLSPKEDFLLVCESIQSRVHIYWLQGPKVGTSEVFLDGLPGSCDNIRPRPDGGYYISLFTLRHADMPDPAKLFQIPIVRKLICRVFACLQLMVDTIQLILPNQRWELISYEIFNLEPLVYLSPEKESIIIEVDENGVIIDSLQGNNGNIRFVSEASHVGDNIFFGSPFERYLGRLYLGPNGSLSDLRRELFLKHSKNEHESLEKNPEIIKRADIGNIEN
ncbi:unnamed protein product, partial [Meganyctiphanes norvegica]